MNEIFQAKYQFVFGGYVQLALAIGVVLELVLIGLREKNRQQSRPEHARRIVLLLLFGLLLTGMDYLRGIGLIEVPQFRAFTPVYRPEAPWYLARAVLTTLALVGFEMLERVVRAKLATRVMAAGMAKSNGPIGDGSQA